MRSLHQKLATARLAVKVAQRKLAQNGVVVKLAVDPMNRFKKKPEQQIMVRKYCDNCEAEQSFPAPASFNDDYDKVESGRVLIQEAMPYLTPSQRELLQTGICEHCWKDMFGQEASELMEREVKH